MAFDGSFPGSELRPDIDWTNIWSVSPGGAANRSIPFARRTLELQKIGHEHLATHLFDRDKEPFPNTWAWIGWLPDNPYYYADRGCDDLPPEQRCG
jgi:hypothetical protein